MKKLFFSTILFSILCIQSLSAQPKLETLTDSLNYSYGVQLAEMIKMRMPEWNSDIIAYALKESLDGNSVLTLEQCQAVAQEYSRIKTEEAKAEGIAFMEEYSKKEGVMTTPSGLMYRHIQEGEGESPIETNRVTVHYVGRLTDGTEFDSSVARGEPMSFGLNGVIRGWTEGLQLMKVGGKTEFVIPPELGYGARSSGKIPPHSVLVFEISLLSYQ